MESKTKSKPLFSRHPCFKFSDEQNQWVEYRMKSSEIFNPNQITLLSWNVLFDLYDKEVIHSDLRTPIILKILKELQPDIIALQEVTQSFLIETLRDSFFQSKYYLSESTMGNSVNPYGQIICSKYPFQVLLHKFSNFKKVIFGEFKFHSRVVSVPVVHLPSDKKSNFQPKERRIEQLQIVYDKVCFTKSEDKSDCFLVGDFNIGDDEDQDIIHPDFIDIWKYLRPSDNGMTFDPLANSFAKMLSSTGRSRRLDRLLMRSMDKFWKPVSIEMIGTSSHKVKKNGQDLEIFASDHFGLLSVFEIAKTD